MGGYLWNRYNASISFFCIEGRDWTSKHQTKQNQTKRSKNHKKLWLAGSQGINLESINTSFLLEMCLKFVKHVGNLPRLSSRKACFISVAPILWRAKFSLPGMTFTSSYFHLFSLLHRFSSGSLLQAMFLALLPPPLTPFPCCSSLLPLHFPLLHLIMLGILIDVLIFHIVSWSPFHVSVSGIPDYKPLRQGQGLFFFFFYLRFLQLLA